MVDNGDVEIYLSEYIQEPETTTIKSEENLGNGPYVRNNPFRTWW